ncbi:uncharacterized protein [Miscanthus floridulus]|uniref:uncharacterized protein n=1 Tax=Miscanthus floridulus TaxID=154761 RepID=UPI00345774C5
MNEDQRSEGFENMNNGLNQAQDQQVLAEPDEQNIMVGMALMPTLQQDTASRVWEEARTKEATKLWDKFFSKETFDWATKFLSSTAIAQISNSQEAGSSMGQDSGKNKGVLIQEIEEIAK